MEKSLMNQFKQNLGVSDATIEYIEVLVRDFENTPHTEDSFQNIASTFNIKVNDVVPETAIFKIRSSYIIWVYQIFENFLNQLHSFLKKYCIYNETKEKKTSLLKHIYQSLIGMQRISDSSYLYYLICDYYRLVRNFYAHTDDLDKIEKLYKQLISRKSEIVDLFGGLNAPNEYDKIHFDDFILYSRTTKELARLLMDNIEYDIEKISNFFELKHFRIYKNNPNRLRKALKTEISISFSLEPEICEVLVDKLIEKV